MAHVPRCTHRLVLGIEGRLAMIDSGHNQDKGWKQSNYSGRALADIDQIDLRSAGFYF